MKKISKLFICLITIIIVAVNVQAKVVNVTSVNGMQAAINAAQQGDEIVLADGIYLNNVISVGSTKKNLIIRAATPGGVFLSGTDDVRIYGNSIFFSGFQFTNGNIDSASIMQVFGSHNTVTQLNFSGYYAKKYIEIKAGSQYNEISYCNIEKKPLNAVMGNTIQISTSATIPGYHKIRYCSFQNYEGIGGDNGNEPVRFGLGVESKNISRTIIEYCYFNNTGKGDSESISVKCKENVIRYCTFTNQQDAMLCFRNGDNNVAYSNFFINAGGIRVKEANNIYCYNNYFQSAGIGSSANAVSYVYYTVNTTNVLNNINFVYNAFVDCGDIDLGGTGATNNTWANNIFKKTSGKIFINKNAGTTWAGNIYTGSLGLSATGFTKTDPLLVLNADGYYSLSAKSPAINASTTAFPAILDIANLDDDPTVSLDISGLSRPDSILLKDVGCSEYTTSSATLHHPLTLPEVGPSYLGGPILPMQLIGFNVTATKNEVTIRWTTANEQNTAFFEVQKSADGLNFTTIQTIEAAHNATSNQQYACADELPANGTNYYRIKLVDADGKQQYSTTKKLVVAPSIAISLYPNPASNFCKLQLPFSVSYPIQIRFFDMEGKLVKKFDTYQPSGYNIASLKSGSYVAAITIGNWVKNVPIVVEK